MFRGYEQRQLLGTKQVSLAAQIGSSLNLASALINMLAFESEA